MATGTAVAARPHRTPHGVVLEVVGGDVQTGARRGDRHERGDVPVAPAEAEPAVAVQHLGGRQGEVEPPHREGQTRPGETDHRHVDRPALGLHEGGQGGDRADQALPEGDDRQQAVSLGDVVRVPGSALATALGTPRTHELDDVQRDHQHEGQPERGVQEDQDHPAQLRHGDGLGVAEAGSRRGGSCVAARSHWKTIATRIIDVAADHHPLWRYSPCSIECEQRWECPWRATSTPTICTIVVTRNSQSSVS